MTLRELAPSLDPKKLVRVEIFRGDEFSTEQHIFAGIKYAMMKMPDLIVINKEDLPWTYVLTGDPNQEPCYLEDVEI